MPSSLLLSEIREQPDVLRRLMEREMGRVQRIAALIRARDARYVLIAARGTSDNAARYAQYLFGARNGLTVALAAPALYTRYHAPPRMDGALVIGISQSGASPDIAAVIEEGRRQGCLTLTITNAPASPLAAAADEVILLHAGEEQSIAATKTYTAQLMALAMLSAALADGERELLAEVPAQIEEALQAAAAPVVEAAERLKAADRCVVIGRGYNYATAFEIALKLAELTRIVAEPFSSADFLHGPIALIERGFPAIVVNPSGRVYDEVSEVEQEMIARGASPVVLSDRADAAGREPTIALPGGVPEWLSPLVSVAPGQLLAYHLSVARGFDPDQPRGLQKVTRTM